MWPARRSATTAPSAATPPRMRAASISAMACPAIAPAAPPAYADTPEGINREHALFGADRCVAVSSSDGCAGPDRPGCQVRDPEFAAAERVIGAQDFFVGPKVDITRTDRDQAGRNPHRYPLPKTWAGANFYFEKVTDRNAWDFPLVNVAGGDAGVRTACIDRTAASSVGGVSAVPQRLTGGRRRSSRASR